MVVRAACALVVGRKNHSQPSTLMNDDIPLEVKIAEAEAQGSLLDEEIQKAAAINSNLGNRLENYRKIQEANSRKVAHLLGLERDNEEIERELARIEGREYRDTDNPEYDYPKTQDYP